MAPREVATDVVIFPTPRLTWNSLITHCKTWRSEVRSALGIPFSKISITQTGKGHCRLYALGTPPSSSNQTVLCADISSSGSETKFRPLLNTETIKTCAATPEFSLLCERLRVSAVTGVTDYSLEQDKSMLLVTGGEIYRWCDNTGKEAQVISLWGGNQANCFVVTAQMCPSDSQLVAFVADRQVHIDRSGRNLYTTSSQKPTISNGVPPFVTQEELDRFTGIWWSPCCTRLLYEQVDEENVKCLSFDCPGKESSGPMRYPPAGTPNARSVMRMIFIEGDKIVDVGLRVPLDERYPWIEYIPRAGFMPDGKTVWMQVMDRAQTRSVLLLIPESEWEGRIGGSNTVLPTLTTPLIVHDERSVVWINTHSLTIPLNSEIPNRVRFLHATEANSHCHLCIIEAEIRADGSIGTHTERAITCGPWSVCKGAGLKVDQTRHHVYFLANIHHPLEFTMCVTNYMDGQFKVNGLTESGWTFRNDRSQHHLSINYEVGFAGWMTNLESPPQCRFYSLFHTPGQLPTAKMTSELVLPGCSIHNRLTDVAQPKMFEYKSKYSGKIHYALLLRPPGATSGVRYPVLQYVYGGPGIQVVKNDWATWVNMLKYAHLGLAVLLVDGRGSYNRGKDFEAPLKNAMGTVELQDQVEALQVVACATNSLDLSRVAIQGWSYGGYLSLLAIAKYPEVYRVCVAGGAVTDWKLYDTAYTERYLGYPINDVVYQKCSVTSVVDKLPDEPGRVLLLHGLIDENVHFRHTEVLIEAMVKIGKPYQLQIFPSERHGVRSSDGGAHMDATVVAFMFSSFDRS